LAGILYLVATPIGNLEDITHRAVRILKEVDLILCENKKNSARLLSHYDIKTSAQTLFNAEESKLEWIPDLLLSGKNLAYISDAGTPGLSDPGANLIRLCRRKEISTIPIPGVSAFASIISVCGFQANPSFFLGFLSEKKIRKKNELTEYKDLEGVFVIYESVYKIMDTLEIISEVFPESEVLIGRELTKIHEEFIFFLAKDYLKQKVTLKGEFVVLINNHLKKIAKAKVYSADS
jgi:16S rRNA (cytidine1402-2'-O)-methyltransferase